MTIERFAARVLLVDGQGRVLLMHGADPAEPDVSFWTTTGGGREDGESDRLAAARELFEETGLRVEPEALIGPIHHEVAEFSFQGRAYRQHQVYFAYRVDSWEVERDHLEPVEQEWIDGHRWWSVEELRTTLETVYPAELTDLLDGFGMR